MKVGDNMKNETIIFNNKQYKRISVFTAKKEYKNNKTIYLIPSNILFDFNSAFYPPTSINKSENRYSTFENFVNCYSVYNCGFETGNYCKFYIEVE